MHTCVLTMFLSMPARSNAHDGSMCAVLLVNRGGCSFVECGAGSTPSAASAKPFQIAFAQRSMR